MRVLGLSGHYHDAAAALVVDGRLRAFAQEERFSRIKQDPATPVRAARWCLAEAGLSPADLDLVVWHEKPLLKLERVLLSVLDGWPRTGPLFRDAMVSLLGNKLWVRAHLVDALGIPPGRVHFSAHHASHAAAAFLASPFDEAAVLCIDGVGEHATTSLWRGRGGALEPLGEIHFPHSVGLLYSTFTAFLGFEVNEGEYKVMGLAPFGQPRYRAEVERLVRVSADGSFELDLDHFAFPHAPDRSWSPRFEAVFGPPRDPRAPLEERHRDLAASLQAVTEDLVLGLARHAHARTGCDALCLAGGVALNAVANGRLAREGPFARLFVQPAAGDAGTALGAALYAAGAHDPLRHVAWGPGIDVDATRRFLDDAGIPWTDVGDRLCDVVADRLAAGQVLGWMQGRFELGPRALGQRSILADPRDAAARERVNARIKFREAFRPFAPSVLAEAAPDLFELPSAAADLTPFMICTVRARDGRVPATVHVDGTARVQTVDRAVLPVYGELLAAVGRRTGVPCVLNTSFNLAGEPIVGDVADGWATLVRSGLDAVVVGPCLVERPR